MPVPTSINDISTDPAMNSPPGTESAKGVVDNYLRTSFAFIAQNRDAISQNAGDIAALAEDLSDVAADLGDPATVVRTSGDQTIDDVKTFLQSPVVPEPTDPDHAADKGSVDRAAPAGLVAYFARNTAPDGWLKANGATVSRTAYAALFAAIGTTFGAGDGSTTFRLPDLRGEFVRGWDDGRGVDSGRDFGSAQLDAFQGHWHRAPWGNSDGSTPRIDTASSQEGIYNNLVQDAVTDGTNGTPRTASETRPRNIALLPCIKY